MCKLLVVDDELIQRDGLVKIIRKIRPLYEVIEKIGFTKKKFCELFDVNHRTVEIWDNMVNS